MNVSIIEEMIDSLENNGEITFFNDEMDIFVQSVDDKEGYSYVSNTNEEFASSEEAIEWVLEQFKGIENIEGFE